MTRLKFVIILGVLWAGSTEAQTVHGKVIHATTGTPLADVSVVILDGRGRVARGTLTETDGSFTLRAPENGKYGLRVGAPGFDVWDSPVLDLDTDDDLEQNVSLVPEGQGTGLGDFERRRVNDEGMFLTWPDFESKASPNFSDVFRNLPGVMWTQTGITLVTGHSGADRAGARQAMEPSTDCSPVLYVDGVWWGKLKQVSTASLPSNELAAIEIYQRNEVPEEFRVNRDALCGVIVAWRKGR